MATEDLLNSRAEVVYRRSMLFGGKSKFEVEINARTLYTLLDEKDPDTGVVLQKEEN